ncbi:hypothetical protein Pogu_1908 [Pyrobaculum oguniense TE7]|uniref:Uncharacterized protein n=1 Tax=Pyrobaculum oguniense (strain DSM 13380 / JCM 10595 / TE7) TaxID=698757 RepID=H6QB11_PYROT|nr:hypothetical protein Pogu_1908 [Pyrobaculum oguniense TE7]
MTSVKPNNSVSKTCAALFITFPLTTFELCPICYMAKPCVGALGGGFNVDFYNVIFITVTRLWAAVCYEIVGALVS